MVISRNKEDLICFYAIIRDLEKEKVSEEFGKWIVLISFDGKNGQKKCIGLNESGEWLVKAERYTGLLSELKYLSFCLPLLETPIEMIQEKLSSRFGAALKERQLEGEDIFPFFEIVWLALKTKQEYWVQLGFKWYESFTKKRKNLFKDELERIYLSGLSQNVRHSALKKIAEIKNDLGRV